jgi:hypothetical protein
MKIAPRIILLVSVAICLSSEAVGQINQLPELEKYANADFYFVKASGLSSPENKIVLFRNSREICALKIINHEVQSGKQKAVSADYEMVRAKPGDLDISRYKVEAGKFTFRGFSGYGHWAEKNGNSGFSCGGRRVSWYYPTSYGLGSSVDILFAPTGWGDFRDIRIDEKNLRWFAPDVNGEREGLKIYIDSLPGAAG